MSTIVRPGQPHGVSEPLGCFDVPVESAPSQHDHQHDTLVASAIGGDRAALRALLVEVAPAVTSAVRSIVGPAAPNKDDLTQDAMIAFMRALPGYRGESSIVRYAYRIAVRTALPECRKNRGRVRLFDTFASAEKVRAEREPTDICVRRSRKDLIRELLAELPEAQAYAFAHRVIWGASLEEIAADTEVSVNTVRTRLRLAKETIRERLEANPELIELLEGKR